jgi:esterase/lipase
MDNNTLIGVLYNYKVRNTKALNTTKYSKNLKEVIIMTKQELENKVQEIRKYKAMIEEATAIEKSLENEVIAYMSDNNLTKEVTDTAQISYIEQSRSTLDKKRLEADLGDLTEYTKVTTYSVLRIK